LCMFKAAHVIRVHLVTGGQTCALPISASSHFYLEDRIAEAYALVKLYESGYADQNDLARAFGYSTRTLRRFQQRLHRGGLNALIRPQGRPAEDSISHIAPRDQIGRAHV